VVPGISHPPVALHSLAARPSLPVACAPAAAGPPPGFGAGAILTAPRRTYGWAGRFHMAPTWCEYTLVSFCHLLLSLKNYISICFRTFPRPASLPGGIQDESEETRPECSLVSGNLGAVPRHTRVRVTGLVSSSVVHISFFPLLPFSVASAHLQHTLVGAKNHNDFFYSWF
jgi:hypothetical protein